MIAHRLGKRVARLRHPIAVDQHLFARRIIGERHGKASTSENIETERGIADRPRHHQAIAGFGTAAADHFARR